jgi:hypothetical protein
LFKKQSNKKLKNYLWRIYVPLREASPFHYDGKAERMGSMCYRDKQKEKHQQKLMLFFW